MAKTQYLDFTVTLTDQVQVTALQAAYPLGRRMSPVAAAAFYAAPIQEYAAAFVAPCTRSPWFWFSPATPQKYPRDQATFSRCSGGWFGICFLFGTTTNYIWVGKFAYAPAPAPEIAGVPVPSPVAIATRRWCEGFNFPVNGLLSTDTLSQGISRDAGRHSDSWGVALRPGNTNNKIVRTLATLVTGISTRQSWERFYVRSRVAPSGAPDYIWMALSGGNGAVLGISPTSQIVLANINGAAVDVLATGTPILSGNTWYKLDVILSFATAGAGVGALLHVYLNGVAIISYTGFPAVGLGTAGDHTSSRLGDVINNPITGSTDLADWINAEWPATDVTGAYVGLDWLNGSRVQTVMGTGYGSSHSVNWTGDYRNTLQNPAATAGGQLTSSTSGAGLALLTDAAQQVDNLKGAVGMAAFIVAMYDSQVGSSDGFLGWLLNGVLQLTQINQTTGGKTFHAVGYFPAGITEPVAMSPTASPFEIRFTKSLDANQCAIGFMGAAVEVLGVFGPEDVVVANGGAATPLTTRQGTHNAPYPTTIWATRGTAPQSPVMVHGGTYVGTGTGLNLTFRAPVNWLWVRRVDPGSSDNLGTRWFSSAIGPHNNVASQTTADMMAQAVIDYAYAGTDDDNVAMQQFVFRIAGTNARANAVGVTYQYIAVADPGMRFLLNGAFLPENAVASLATTLLNTNFTPDAGFVHVESVITASTSRLYYKGPGHTGAFASLVNAAEANDLMTFAQGLLTTRTALHIDLDSVAYALWRLLDGNIGPGVPVQILSYVGDGTASRVINLTPVSGRRPLFALVVPHNAGSITRDPSNLTTTSDALLTGTENTTTGITAGGIDQITVGITLNAAGIVYDVFVLPGGTAACNNGWSCNGEFWPVEPDSPVDGPWDAAPAPEPPAPPAPAAADPLCPTPVIPAFA